MTTLPKTPDFLRPPREPFNISSVQARPDGENGPSIHIEGYLPQMPWDFTHSVRREGDTFVVTLDAADNGGMLDALTPINTDIPVDSFEGISHIRVEDEHGNELFEAHRPQPDLG
jgi:hypothetical protein